MKTKIKKKHVLTIVFVILLSLVFLPKPASLAFTENCPPGTPFVCKEDLAEILKSVLTPIQTAIQNLTNTVSSLQTTTATQSAQIQSLQTQNASFSAQLTSLQQQVTNLELLLTPTATPIPTATPTPSPTVAPSPTPQPQVLLYDDFTGSSLDQTVWDEFDNGGTVTVQNSLLMLPGGSNMSFIRAKANPLPSTGTYTVEFKIQYTAANPSGDGVGLSLTQQDNSDNLSTNEAIAFWQDSASGLSIVQFGLTVAKLGGIDLNSHIGKISYDGTEYLVYLDGNLVYTSAPTGRAQSLWMGHPQVNVTAPWSGFNMDYIKVTSGLN